MMNADLVDSAARAFGGTMRVGAVQEFQNQLHAGPGTVLSVAGRLVSIAGGRFLVIGTAYAFCANGGVAVSFNLRNISAGIALPTDTLPGGVVSETGTGPQHMVSGTAIALDTARPAGAAVEYALNLVVQPTGQVISSPAGALQLICIELVP